jgi:ATP-binding cassette subfamily C protein CydC
MQYRSGDLLARTMADIETLENFYLRIVTPMLAGVLVTALGYMILARFDTWLGLTLLLFAVLAGVVLPLAVRRLSRRPAAVMVATRAEMNAAFVDEIQGIADMLAYGQESVQQAKAHALSGQLHWVQEQLAMMRGLGNGLAAFLTGLAGLVVLGLAIPLVSSGAIDGVFLALLPLTAIVTFEVVQPLAQAFQSLEASQAAARRIFDLIDATPPLKDPSGCSPPPTSFGIEVENLSFRYTPGEMQVLDGISFSVPPGGRIAIAGPNGSGKSTIVNLLLRFWDYQDGRISVGGHELHEYPADSVRQWFGVVSQNTHLFNTTVRENLYLAKPDASQSELEDACRQALLHDSIQGFPDGYDTLIGENGQRLSGGERQRLAIARAILKNPPILILDEATTHLDAVTEQHVWQALEQFMCGRTTIIISHQPVGLAHIDQVFVLGSPPAE